MVVLYILTCALGYLHLLVFFTLYVPIHTVL